MNYLKALGVLRLVSEQADPEARGCWRDDVFVLQSKLARDSLIQFFLNEYSPTPVVGPWAGGSGFFSKDNKKGLDSLASSTCARCAAYRQIIGLIQAILKQAGIKDRPTAGQKAELLRRYRSELPPEALQWMDAAVVLQSDGQAFAPLLGTGGNDGRLDFTQNFMARLVTLGIQGAGLHPHVGAWLENAIFGVSVPGLDSAAVGQFAPGRAGGPNSTQGMEGEAAVNPWDFVLMIEGVLILGGAAVRRFAADTDSRVAFPFTVRPAAVGYASESDADPAADRGEIWLPVWERPAVLAELRTLFGEGRAEVAGRPARDGVDFARAVAGLGVDRGIGQFIRLSFLKRSGKAYLATPIGRFAVRERRSVDLLREVDAWLDRFRRACAGDNAPPRFKAALRGIEQAIFDFCRYGGPTFFQAILSALGHAERELACGERFRTDNWVPPVACLSRDWIDAASDGTPEFELALALAGISDREGKIGPLRTNLEPVDVWRNKDGKLAAKWAEKDRAVVWNSGGLLINLAQVLARRIMDGGRAGCKDLPLAAANFVSLDALSEFLAGELDDRRVEALVWGLMLIKQKTRSITQAAARADAPPLPRSYALLKLLFLPEPLQLNGEPVRITPEPGILTLLRAGHTGQACRIAMCRLRASGLTPLPGPRSGAAVRDGDWLELDELKTDRHRLAAALLLPISRPSAGQLRDLAVRRPKTSMGTP
jgi:CRISPR-associated protein Csx17